MHVREEDIGVTSFKGFDVIHVFSASCLPAVKLAKKAGFPVIASPIFWPRYRFYRELEYTDFLGPLDLLLVKTRHSAFGRFLLDRKMTLGSLPLAIRYHGLYGSALYNLDLEQYCFSLADFLLPNSEVEQRKIKEVLGIVKPYSVIPNAVDIEVFLEDKFSNLLKPSFLPDNYLLSVGAISPRKNTLKLIRSANQLGIQLVLVGPIDKSSFLSRRYYKSCIKEARDRVLFVGEINHELLPLYYKHARVHALVSWYETPGLATLEAAVMGCSVVSTSEGSTEEYLKQDAEYCDPADQNSIDEAISRAWETSPSKRLRNRILSLYTWERVASLTVQAYERVLSLY